MKHLLLGPFLIACLIPPPQAGQGPPPSSGDGPPPSSGEGPPPSSGNGPPPSGGAPSRPAPPQGPIVVSVRVHSDCPRNVKVFYGDKPKFGSGTYSTISSNSTESHSFKAGEMMWIVDESENGVTSATIGGSTHEITISGSCTQFSTR